MFYFNGINLKNNLWKTNRGLQVLTWTHIFLLAFKSVKNSLDMRIVAKFVLPIEIHVKI